jgi:hypothetical protein
MGITRETELNQPYKMFTAVGFGVEKAGVDELLSHARDAAFSSKSKATIQIADGGGQVFVQSDKDRMQQLSYSRAKQSIGLSELGIEYDVYNQSKENSSAHVKLSSSIFNTDKQNFNIHADGQTITGSCDTKDKITTCTEQVQDALGNVILKGISTSDIYKNPSSFNRTTDYTDGAGKPLGRITQAVQYDSAKGQIIVDSNTTK